MDPSLMPDDEREARRHIIIPMGEQPATEAGRMMHREWHERPEAPRCGTLGCGFLGRILAVEYETRDLPGAGTIPPVGKHTPDRDSWVDGFRQGMIVAGQTPPWTRGEVQAEYDRTWPTDTDPFRAPEDPFRCDYCREGLPKDAEGWHLREDPEGIEGTARIPCMADPWHG